MRRAHLDQTDQPVRNLVPNPGGETGAELVTVRTNLALDPNATSLTNWSIIGSVPYVRSVDAAVFHSGTTAIKNVANAVGRLGVKAMIAGGVTSGETVTWSLWVYSSVAVTGNPYWERLTPTYAGSAAAGTFTVPADTWTEIVGSYTFNAAQADPAGLFGFGFYTAESCAIGSMLYGDEAIIVKGFTTGPFFSGATPALGDFVHAWLGTPNQSASILRGTRPVTYAATAAVIQSAEWAAGGSKSLRVFATAPTNDSYTNLNGDTSALRLGMEPGKTYTAMAKLRLAAPLTGTPNPSRALSIVAFTRVGAANYVEHRSNIAPNAVGVTPVAVTFTLPPGATEAFVRLYNGFPLGGGEVWYDQVMLVEGAYAGDYVDGSRPLARWDGVPNFSTSVGYPPGLLELAGPPAVDIAGLGNTGGAVIPVAPYAARSLYLCYEVGDATSNYPNFGTYGVAGSRGITFQTGPAGSSTMFPRLDFAGGSVNMGVTMVGGRAQARRHVISMVLPEGLTTVRSSINGSAERTDAVNPGPAGWDDGRAAVNAAGTNGRGHRMLVYYAEHDNQTRLAVARYLGNKYGANVA